MSANDHSKTENEIVERKDGPSSVEKEEQRTVVDNRSDVTSTKSRDGPTTADQGVKEDEETALGAIRSNRPNYSSFSLREKRFIVFMAAFAGFFSPLSANIYFPVSIPSPTLLSAIPNKRTGVAYSSQSSTCFGLSDQFDSDFVHDLPGIGTDDIWRPR
jgi:hypothetical protein